jgi:hypothetical protein
LAARIGAFAASCCYAKITPAALQRGEIAKRSHGSREPVGRKPEFEPCDFSRPVSEPAARGQQTLSMAAS